MTRRTRVYIAGPYSTGDQVLNVRAAVDAANALFDAGYAPYVPHLTHLWHIATPRSYDDWMTLDFEWVKACDVLLRLPGESSGADRETIVAAEERIPVFFAIDELMRYVNPRYKP